MNCPGEASGVDVSICKCRSLGECCTWPIIVSEDVRPLSVTRLKGKMIGGDKRMEVKGDGGDGMAFG